MEGLVIILIILIILFGGGGWWVGRPGYAGPGSGAATILYILAVVILVILVFRLLGVASI